MNIILIITKCIEYLLSGRHRTEYLTGVSSFNSHGIPKAISIIRSILQMRNWGLWVKELAGTCLVQGLRGSLLASEPGQCCSMETLIYLLFFSIDTVMFITSHETQVKKKTCSVCMHLFFNVLFWNNYSVLGSSRETEQIGDICICISRTYIYLEQCGVRGTNAPMQ